MATLGASSQASTCGRIDPATITREEKVQLLGKSQLLRKGGRFFVIDSDILFIRTTSIWRFRRDLLEHEMIVPQLT